MSGGSGKPQKLNLPNRLTLARLIMVPFCIAAVIMPESAMPETVSRLIAFALFVAASVTDCLDGKIARKRGLVTDFGKLVDPLADKFMVIGTMMAVFYRYENVKAWLFWVLIAVIFRELGVTSLRLVTAGRGVVVAASMLGKVKTVLQIVTVSALLAEPLLEILRHQIQLHLQPGQRPLLAFARVQKPISLSAGILSAVMTVWSGADYFRKLWKYVDPQN